MILIASNLSLFVFYFVLKPATANNRQAIGELSNDSGKSSIVYDYDTPTDKHDENAARYRHPHHNEIDGEEVDMAPSTLNSLLLALENNEYDNRFRPHHGGIPVMVYCSVYISSVTALSEVNMDFTLDFYILQSWNDHRITWETDDDIDEIVNIADENIRLIWQPDTYIINAKYGSFHDVTKANTFLEIDPHGHIQQSSRITVTCFCHMDFREFPFDSQKCSMLLEAYSMPFHDVQYQWLMHRHDQITTPFAEYNHAASFAKGASLVHYSMNGFRIYETSAIGHDGLNRSRLVIDIFFSRKTGFYVIQIYLPAALMTMSSWISFWLPRNSAPARVTLSVTVNLAMVTLNFQEMHLPRLSYLKALDIYLWFCFIMVFLTLIEFAAVSYAAESLKKSRRRFFIRETSKILALCNDEGDTLESPKNSFSCQGPEKATNNKGYDTFNILHNLIAGEFLNAPTRSSSLSYPRDIRAGLAGKLENASRLLFPSAFIIFNIYYWMKYFYLNEDYSSVVTEGMIRVDHPDDK